MQNPILLISPEAAAISIGAAIRNGLNLPVARASSRRAGLAMLRRGHYLLVILDEVFADTDVATDLIFQNAGTAPVIEVDFAAMPTARVVRHARSALQRRAQDEQRAREAAAASLEAELRGLLSGLLLESQLALREAKPEQAPKLRQLVQMAGDLRDRLRV